MRGPDAEAILDALLRSDRVGVAVLDRDLRYVQINAMLAAVNQRPIEAHLGRTVREVIGVFAPEVEATLRRVAETGDPVLDVPIEGERVSLRVSYFPTPGATGLVAVCVEDTGEPEGTLSQRLRFETTLLEVTADLVGARSEIVSAAESGSRGGEARSATSSRSIQEGIERSLALVGEVLRVDAVLVFRADAALRMVEVCHAWSRPGAQPSRPVGDRRPIEGRWLLDELLAGRTVVIQRPADLPPEAEAERRLLAETGLGAVLLAPLMVAGRLLGALALECASPRVWPHTFTTRMSIFAEVLAAAMHRSKLEREAASERAFERLVTEVSARFVEQPFAALDATLERLAAALGVTRMNVYELDWERRLGRLVKEGGAPLAMLEAGDVLSIEELAPSLATRQATDLETVVVERDTLTRAIGAAWDEAGIRACVVTFLGVEGRALGTLGFCVSSPEQLDARFYERAELLRSIFASALARRLAERAQAAAHAELEALKRRIELERDYLREEARADHGEVLAESRAMREVLEHVEAVAPTEATVLLVGETGVGKEVVARRVHAVSRRAEGPLIRVNCASVPAELFESEFFGHVRGAFTGAHRDRQGRFELADGGTLFLDEVGEIPIGLQAKLLRVLQEGELERVGDDRTLRVDVRVVAATNRDLEREVEEGRFRRDLYYRLGVFPIRIPPLRERLHDILPFARRFLQSHAARLGRRGLEIGPEQASALLAYPWPGNVRELDHVIERAVILSARPPLRLELGGRRAAAPDPVLPAVGGAAEPPEGILTADALRQLERSNLEAALAKTGKVSGRGGAAELLGMSASTLRDRMRALGVRSTR